MQLNIIHLHHHNTLASFCLSVCQVCLSVCLCMLLQSQVLFYFDEICTVVWSLKSKTEFVRVKIQRPFPILPQFFTTVMHFQWEDPNTAVMRPIVMVDSSNDVPLEQLYAKPAKCCKPQFATKTINEDKCIFNENMLS